MHSSSKRGLEYAFARSESSAPFGTLKARMSEVIMPRRARSMNPFGCVARVSERLQVSSARTRSGPPAPQSSCITAITFTSVPVFGPGCAASCRTTCCLKVEISSVSSLP
eukprot:scaffold934_cov69-Phaeocystis_antarctica.AAC.3